MNNNQQQQENEFAEVQAIYGRRAVMEALRAGRSIEKIYVAFSAKNGVSDIVREAKKRTVPFVIADKRKFAHIEDTFNAYEHSQGVIALVSPVEYIDPEVMFARAESKAQQHNSQPLIVALDGINDPHNLGAIARSVLCAGGHGLLLPAHHSAPITSASIKTSAGALEHLYISKCHNLTQALELAKERGYWVIGTDMSGTHEYTAELYNRPVILVIGSEGSGMRETTKKMCDAVISIPLRGPIQSLNASVACGVVCFEIQRQRLLQSKK